MIRDALRHPLVYQCYQQAGGFFGARRKATDAFLSMKSGDSVADIGCGPGFMAKYLPDGISYSGFDTDARYIEYAAHKFGSKGRFIEGRFDEAASRRYGPFDVVMMNGLLHHLNDDEAHQTLGVSREALRPGGRLFTLDGCYADEQSPVAAFLLKFDRGEHVRTEEQYRSLMERHFDTIEVHVEHDLSWVPYTWIVMVGHI